MIIEEELSCKCCVHLDILEMHCSFGYELGKDEFAQTFPMYSFLTNKVCNDKQIGVEKVPRNSLKKQEKIGKQK